MSYHRPTDLIDALTLLGQGNPTILAGGTDIYPATDRPELTSDVLDITAIPSLCGITQDGSGFRIGAATKWSEIIATDLPPSFNALQLSAREVGSIQIQNSGTIGGNLCNASPAADGVPPLLILNASVELTSRSGTRTMPLQNFILGNRHTQLEPGEMLTAVLIPKAATAGQSHFLKLGARKYLIISIGMVAVRLTQEAGRITEAAVAIGACSAVATRLESLERHLIGQTAKTATIPADLVTEALSPIDDIRADKAYRLKAASALVTRTIRGIAT